VILFWDRLKRTKQALGSLNIQEPDIFIHSCSAASGMGKTTFVQRGIDQIQETQLFRNDQDEELKTMFRDRIYLHFLQLQEGITLSSDDHLGKLLLHAYITGI
jgi:hypothetical protein